MKRISNVLSIIIVALLVAMSSSWQTTVAKVRLSASTNTSGNVHRLDPPGTNGQKVYDYGCNWAGSCYSPKAFSISANKQIFLTNGNVSYMSKLELIASPIPSGASNPGNGGMGSVSKILHSSKKWFVAEHQWESLYNMSDLYFLQEDNDGCVSYSGKGYIPVTISQNLPYTKYEDKFSYFDEKFKFECEDDWATIMPSDDPRRYFALESSQWHYLLFQRPNASELREVGQMKCLVLEDKVQSEYGLFLYPDGYTGPKAGSAAVDSVTWFKMENAGAIFLPTTGKTDEGLEYGLYWTSSSLSAVYFDTTGKIGYKTVSTDQECAVRLAYYFRQGTGTKSDPFKISSGADLAAFRDVVNSGHSDLCGELTSNISLQDYDDWEPIGCYMNMYEAYPYNGKFNGNGYQIYNLSQKTLRGDALVSYSGLFGLVTDGAEIADFILSGDVKITDESRAFAYGASPVVGIISLTSDADESSKGALVRDILCQCKYSLNASAAGVVFAGGIVGKILGGSSKRVVTQVARCWNITGGVDVIAPKAAANAVYLGGVVGYGPTDGGFSILACGYYSSLTLNGEDAGCAILGYQDCSTKTLTVSIRNCYAHYGGKYAIARLDNVDTQNGATIATGKNYYRKSVFDDNVVNCNVTFSDFATGQTEAEIKSGKTTYLLNNSVSGGEPWHQSIGVFPVLQKTVALVYATDDPDVFSNVDPSLATDIELPVSESGEVVIYDLMGRKLDKLQKGINIVNGKKVLVK